MSEWSLVLFTLFTQAAVGVLVVSTLLLWRVPQPAAGETRALRAAGRLALPLVLIGLAFSLIHLGSPGGSFRVLANLGSSWLSREILLTLLFAAGAGVTFYLWKNRPQEPGATFRWTVLVTALLGLAAVFSTGMVYQLPSRPPWQHWSNVAAGFVSTLLLGSLIVAVLLGTASRKAGAEDSSGRAWQVLGVTILVAAALLVIGLTAYGPHLVRVPDATAVLVFGSPWFWVRLLVGIGLPVAVASRLLRGGGVSLPAAVVALVAAVGGEWIGRTLFYASVLSQLPLF